MNDCIPAPCPPYRCKVNFCAIGILLPKPNAFVVYYKSNKAALYPFNGLVVTMNVFVYSGTGGATDADFNVRVDVPGA